MENKPVNHETGSWSSPQTRDLLKWFFLQSIQAGIYQTYRDVIQDYSISQYGQVGDSRLRRDLFNLTHNEMPILPMMFHEDGRSTVYLAKRDSNTGRVILTPEGDGMVFVTEFNTSQETAVESLPNRRSRFSEEQISLILRQAVQLKELRLID